MGRKECQRKVILLGREKLDTKITSKKWIFVIEYYGLEWYYLCIVMERGIDL